MAVLTFEGVLVYEIGAQPTADDVVSFDRGADRRSAYRRRDDPVQVCIRTIQFPRTKYRTGGGSLFVLLFVVFGCYVVFFSAK